MLYIYIYIYIFYLSSYLAILNIPFSSILIKNPVEHKSRTLRSVTLPGELGKMISYLM